MEAKEMAKLAVAEMKEKKAVDVKVIDIEKISTLADYFIITSGTNRNQVQAMAEAVEEELQKHDIRPKNIEGYQTGNWILMDMKLLIGYAILQSCRASIIIIKCRIAWISLRIYIKPWASPNLQMLIVSYHLTAESSATAILHPNRSV